MAENASNPVEDEIARLKSELGAETDAELATVLGLQRSAIAQWKKRGRVPDKAKRRVAWLKEHRNENEYAKEDFNLLSVSLRQICRAVALLYIVRTSDTAALEPDILLGRSLFFDEIERASFLLLSDIMDNKQIDAAAAYNVIFSLPNLETDLAEWLEPARQIRK